MAIKKPHAAARSMRSVTRELGILRRRIEALEDRLTATPPPAPRRDAQPALDQSTDLARLMATLEFASREFNAERCRNPVLQAAYKNARERMNRFLREKGFEAEE